jgi:hypothetical protein
VSELIPAEAPLTEADPRRTDRDPGAASQRRGEKGDDGTDRPKQDDVQNSSTKACDAVKEDQAAPPANQPGEKRRSASLALVNG